MKKCAWYGTIKIKPVTGEPFYLTGEWEYRGDYNCWYLDGNSYPEEICELVVE